MDTPGVEEKEAEMRARQLERARQLVAHMESGDDDSAGRLIEELGRMHESLIFQELGKLTRDLHEALNAFRTDSRLSEIAETDIPDAKERLNYVVTLTEQSAHRTLNAVEESLPMAESLAGRAGELSGVWERFKARELSAEEFRQLSADLGDFLNQTGRDAEVIRKNLSDVLMAQDFQDLTGQVIRRVINLVHDVEQNLVGLVRISGERLSTPEQKKKKPKQKSNKGTGPAVPGTVDGSDVVSGQDDVDDLLSSLGF
ncbi:chemotaxis protein CheZ [Thioalkalivibrio denitrificans]|uniref:Protein phosphatase CheZ n=1 Tax=Thioalkalivibrio denitrificans TaxID=108003 RepID=A0A1V3NME3_9GAMM|nr:chemotaxis protein CheZ [Thioalkalivibrio denitrificans]